MQPTESSSPSFWVRHAISIKGIVIAILVLILLIPTGMIALLVNERESRKLEVVNEVSAKWGNAQTLIGPVLGIPYLEYTQQSITDAKGKNVDKVVKEIRYAYFLPDQLTVNGKILPEKRYRSIYEIVVYGSELSFKGNFGAVSLGKWNVAPENWLLKEAFVAVGISDLRGIEEQIKLNWRGQKVDFQPGIPAYDFSDAGVHAPVDVPLQGQTSSFDFSLSLKGSRQLFFVPVGKETIVSLQSTWPSPSFDGQFLPDKRKVESNGFSATWKILDLNRNFPQTWTGTQENIRNSGFGVNLLTVNDSYQQTMRSVKYAVMLIALTFTVFFFIELLNNQKVHPFQYLLIGLSLCIFYTLLLSISEYLSFQMAYGVATILTLGLILVYTQSLFQQPKLVGLIGGVMVLMYGFVFVVIQLEDTALLVGSIGLFLVLAAVMYFSRKIHWYNTSKPS